MVSMTLPTLTLALILTVALALAPSMAVAQPAPEAAPEAVAASVELEGAGPNDGVAIPAVDPRLLQALAWRNIGPLRGGRATAVAGVPQYPDRFYFGATGGGLWRTDDAGTIWRNISDGFFETGSVGAVAVAPSDPNVVYAGLGEAPVRGVMTTHGDGVYRSTDGGATWQHLGLEDSRHISRVQVHPHDPDTVWVAAQGHLYGPNETRGIYRSTDGGTTWTRTLFVDASTGASDLTLDPSNPRVLYAAMWQHRRFAWRIESGGPGSGVWKSVDGGVTWTRLENGLPERMGKIGVAVSPARPSRVWAMIEAEEGGLFRSDDSGSSFTRIQDDRLLRARAWYYTHVIADPRDADTVYVLNAPMMRSIDGGKSFERVPTPHGDNHALWINPQDSRLMINANDGGASVSRNGGRSWSTQDNQPTGQFYRVIADRRFPYWVYGGQQDNSAIAIKSRSLRGARITERDWYSIGGCESAWPAFDPEDPRYVYAGCYQGLIDEYDQQTGLVRGVMAVPFLGLGAEPRDLPYRFNWNAPIVVSPHDPSVIYHAGNVVLRSSDRGRSWQEISPDLTRDEEEKQGPGGGPITNEAAGGETYNTITTLVVSPHAADTLWVGTDDGRVQVTLDGGSFWRDVSPEGLEGAQINAIEISPHAPDSVYLAVSRAELDDLKPRVYVSDDAGLHWSLRTDGLRPEVPVRVVREDPVKRGLLYAGTEIGVSISLDSGITWQPLELGLPKVPVTDLTIRDHDLIAATQGRGFWILDDLTPLETLAFGRELTLRLLAPRDAVRVAGSGPSPGGDAASWPGSNPPYGAFIDYVLPEAPAADAASAAAHEPPDEPSDPGPVVSAARDAADGVPQAAAPIADDAPDTEVVLEILDAEGQLLRSVSSRPDPVDEASAGADGMDEKAEILPHAPGLNRYVWDLRRDRMLGLGDLFVFGDRGGYRVGPGRYTIRLKQGQQAAESQVLAVLPDPRIEASPADFLAQQALLASIRATLQAIHDSVVRMRDASAQIETLLPRLEALGDAQTLRDSGQAVVDAIEGWQEGLVQPDQETFQDVINFPNRLNAELFFLLGEVDTIEPIVNDGARARFAELRAVWQAHATRMQGILDQELAGFERLLDQHAVPAIIVPPSKLEAPAPATGNRR